MNVMKHFKKAANHKGVIQACNLNTEDAEAEGSQIRGHPKIERSCFIRTTSKKMGIILCKKKKLNVWLITIMTFLLLNTCYFYDLAISVPEMLIDTQEMSAKLGINSICVRAAEY